MCLMRAASTVNTGPKSIHTDNAGVLNEALLTSLDELGSGGAVWKNRIDEQLCALQKEAVQLSEKQENVNRYIQRRYYPLLKLSCFCLLGIQFVVYFDWIFFVFDWNLVEPTTYFLGYTAVFTSILYHYYTCGETEYTWKNVFEYFSTKKAYRMYRSENVDLVSLNSVKKLIRSLKDAKDTY